MDKYIPASMRLPSNSNTTGTLRPSVGTARSQNPRNLEKTREKARQQMQLAPHTAESMAKAAEKCYARNADYRESLRKRKFVAQFGEEAFFGFYLPQHKRRGAEYLPGLAVKYAQLEKHEHLVKEKGGGKATQAQVQGEDKMSVSRWGCYSDFETSPKAAWHVHNPNHSLYFLSQWTLAIYPFFPNAGNFVGFKEHDKNPRKFWFLVLSDGLFTKKTDEEAASGSSKVYIFFTRKEARDKWDKNCLQRHTHDGNGRVVPDSEEEEDSDGASLSSDDNSPSMRSVSSTASCPTPIRKTTVPPAHRTTLQNSPKPTPPPKRESPRVSALLHIVSPRPQSRIPVKKEFVLPLFRDDTPPLEMEVDTAPAHEVTPRSKPLKTGATPLHSTSLATPPSGVSHPHPFRDLTASVSAPRAPPSPSRFPNRAPPTSSEGVSHPHPFRDLSASVSAPRVPPSPSRFPSRAPAATSVHLPPAARGSASGSSGSAAPHPHAGGPNSGPSNSRPPFLYNETSRKLYKDAQKAIQEMGDTDTVHVVDYKDAVQYLSAGRGSN
ncbi:hypothetical protein B0H14DRAFT_2602488 [Mycena olivaceomarginata]|nr:hypothetical protein B0H14DRAFT_2602488 [Mycena olivaceomarginata]